jgi:hypothetical protein
VLTEDREKLFVTGHLDEHLARQGAELAAEMSTSRLASIEVSKQQQVVALEDLASIRGLVRITFVKHRTPATARFFTAEGLGTSLARDDSMGDVSTVLVADVFPSFSSRTASYRTWEEVTADGDPVQHDAVDPRRYIIHRERIIPPHVGPLLPKDGVMPLQSKVADVWMTWAMKTLPLLLADEVAAGGVGSLVVTFSTPRTNVEIATNGPLDRELTALGMDAVAWVYDGASGVQSRHNFLAAELARMWQEGEDWSTGFRRIGSRALESAKSAQRLLDSGKTSDVLKAEGDLRKALNDEVTRVNQQIRDLTGSLWRDFAVAVGALVAKATLPKAGASADGVGLVILVGAVAFLIASLAVTVYANQRLLTIARETRGSWQRDVYAFLTDPQVESLALKPIRDAEAVYARVQCVAICAYAVMVIAMLIIGLGGDGSATGGMPSRSPLP